MADLVDEDDFPNDFDGLDFDNIPGLEAPTTTGRTPEVARVLRSIAPPAVASPVLSSGSNSVEDMDSAFLAAVDALEARALSEMARGSQPSVCTDLDALPVNANGEPSTSRKGKRKAEPRGDMDIRALLAGYETELTCPICYDLLVAAQVTNPCGHTCCGVCIYEWLQRNKYEPTCPVCRSKLSMRKPLLPNFSVDNLVHQHLRVLAKSGRPEWQEKGYKTIEWNKRLESWKEQAVARAAKEKLREGTSPRRRQTRHYEIGDYPYAGPWAIDEGVDDEYEAAIVVHVSPRRGSRTRH